MSLSAEDLAHARAAAERTAIAQGFPPKITDRVVLAKVAALIRGAPSHSHPVAHAHARDPAA